ncbi:MAG: hypothetical protein U1A78_35370 [Polyangia bacterium]
MSESFLYKLGVPRQCISKERSAKEHGRFIRLAVKEDWIVERGQVDGCWIRGTDQKKVDFLFHIATGPHASAHRAALVELKGGHIGHALDQVDSTLSYLSRIPHWNKATDLKRFAFIVVSNGRNLPHYQQKISAIRKQYQVKITIREQIEIKAKDIDL